MAQEHGQNSFSLPTPFSTAFPAAVPPRAKLLELMETSMERPMEVPGPPRRQERPISFTEFRVGAALPVLQLVHLAQLFTRRMVVLHGQQHHL